VSDERRVAKHLVALDAMSKALVKEQADLDAAYNRIRTLPAGHPDNRTHAKRLREHPRRTIEFAQAIRRLLNTPNN